MSKLKKVFNMKTAHGFLRMAIAGMLVFSMLIPTAVSYQQAISSSSENVYSIGDGINVSLRVRQGESDTLYPVDEVDFEPIVTNNGSQAAWVVVAVKIPSMSQPFSAKDSSWGTINYHINKGTYYPALYVVEKAHNDGSDDAFEIWCYSEGQSNYWSHYTDRQDRLNYMYGFGDYTEEDDEWVGLDINTDYAYQENGFYIYYYGYRTSVNSGKSVSPFSRLVSANFQDKVTVGVQYDSDGNPVLNESIVGYNYLVLKDIDCQYRNCNIGVEAKAYAIQTSYAENGNAESNITDIWEANKSKFPAFGSETVVNVVTSTSYTTGEHDIEFVVTKDVQSLQIKNATTGKVVTVSDTQSAVDTGTDFKTITVPVDFQASGVYQVSASSKASAVKDDYINAVDMGYIEVTND